MTKNAVRQAGFFSSVALAVSAAATLIVAFCTPPISGPFAKNGITYPYTDILDRFPRDYYWMFLAMLLMLVFVAYMACMEQYTAANGCFVHSGKVVLYRK